LGLGAFVVGSTALDADDRIIYNQGTGALYYDADGRRRRRAVHFATLSGHRAITISDFMVI